MLALLGAKATCNGKKVAVRKLGIDKLLSTREGGMIPSKARGQELQMGVSSLM